MYSESGILASGSLKGTSSCGHRGGDCVKCSVGEVYSVDFRRDRIVAIFSAVSALLAFPAAIRLVGR